MNKSNKGLSAKNKASNAVTKTAGEYAYTVSVIVPIYNSEQYVNDLLDQLEGQTQKNIEIILVDDGSTDDTAKLIQARAEKNQNIRYFYQENAGAGVARNLGLQHAQGKYFICVDADDLYDAKLVETLYQTAEKDQADMVVCAFSRKNYWTNSFEKNLGVEKDLLPKKHVFSGAEIEKPFKVFNQGPINKLYRKSFVDNLGVHFSSTHIANDVFFYCATIIQAKRIVFEEQNLVTVRRYVNENSISARRADYICEALHVYKEVYEYLCARKLDKKYRLSIIINVTDAVNYNSQYRYSPEFVNEITSWLKGDPWCDLTIDEIKIFFSEEYLIKRTAVLEKMKEKSANNPDDKSIKVQIEFTENRLATLRDILAFIDKEFVGAKKSTLKVEASLNSNGSNPKRQSPLKGKIRKALAYYHENGFRITLWRIKSDIKQFFRKRNKRVLLNTIDKRIREVQRNQTASLNTIDKRVREVRRNQAAFFKAMDDSLQNTAKMQEKSDAIEALEVQRAQDIADLLELQKHTERIASETLWAQIWNSTITDSTWLKDRKFSPGRFAVGYSFLYILYRILDEVKPQNILELGLGQSTKLFSQYVQTQPTAKHQVVESDKDWIDFFSHNYTLPKNTEAVYLDTEVIEKAPGENVRIFKNFTETFQNQKFDCIFIDAPRGDMSSYSRIDILPLLPDCLEENFVIMVHDCHREGELRTAKQIERALANNGITYHKRNYESMADTMLITSDKLKFLTTL